MLQAFDWLAALLPLMIGSEPYVQHAESIYRISSARLGTVANIV